jgi:membrane glycosyltransferase
MTPVVVGLVLAVPLAAMTAQPGIGRLLKSAGLLLTPEERYPPAVLLRAHALMADGPPAPVPAEPFARLAADPALLQGHLQMLPAPPARRRGEVDVDLVVALAKIDEADGRGHAVELLSVREKIAVLGSRPALDRLFAKSR